MALPILLVWFIGSQLPAVNASSNMGIVKTSPLAEVAFQNIGHTVATRGDAHITFDIDPKAILHAFARGKDKSQIMFEHQAWTHFQMDRKKEGFPHFHRVEEAEKRVKDSLQVLGWTDSAASRRNKREVMTLVIGGIAFLASTLLGLYTAHELTSIKSAVDQAQREQDLLALRVHDDTGFISANFEDIRAMRDFTDQLHEEYYDQNKFLAATLLGLKAEKVAQDLSHLANNLLNHQRLYPGATNFKVLAEAYYDIEKEVKEHGLRLLTDGPAGLYQCYASFLTTTEAITVFIHVPVAQLTDNMLLFRYLSTPIEIETGIYLVPRLTKTIIATSADAGVTRFYTLSEAQLYGCDKRGSLFLCPNTNTARITKPKPNEKTEEACLYSLYHQEFKLVNTTCEFTISTTRDEAQQIGPRDFNVYNEVPHRGLVYCPTPEGEKRVSFAANHKQRITLRPGCTATTDTHELSAGFTLLKPTDAQTTSYDWPEDFFPFDEVHVNNTERLRRFQARLDERAIDIAKTRKQEQELLNQVLAHPPSALSSGLSIIVLAVLILFALLIAFVYVRKVCKKKLARPVLPLQQPGPTPPPTQNVYPLKDIRSAASGYLLPP